MQEHMDQKFEELKQDKDKLERYLKKEIENYNELVKSKINLSN